jgi:hypothetical protein
MGALDEAIREHLELKRRQGAAEEELKQKEDEAFGRGGRMLEQPPSLPEPVPELALEDEAGAASPEAAEPAALPAEPAAPPAEPAAPLAEPAPSPVVDPVELEPDEVLPEESLALEDAIEEPAVADRAEDLDPEPDWRPREAPEDEVDLTEDVLEETPDFLEETPEQDRLWFEQKPPKDFDFDD